MKKHFTKHLGILLSILVCCLSFAFQGCDSDHGYKKVSSITFTTNGTTKTQYSKAYPKYENLQGKITQKEYDSYKGSKYLHKLEAFYDGIELLPQSKTEDSYYGLTEDDIGKTVMLWKDVTFMGGIGNNIVTSSGVFTFTYDVSKVIFNGWYYRYLYVKVIDNDTISYHFGSENQTYTYKVSYYRITQFNN